MAHVDRLANTHVLVFGGTSGIGYAIANMALHYGARVTISGSGQAKVDTKVEKLRSLYPNTPASNVAGFAADLLDKENLEKNLKSLLDQVTNGGKNKVDHIAFTAGDQLSLPKVQEVTIETALHGFTVRFLAPAIIAKLLSTGAYMPVSANSSFTLTGGTNTHRPMPNWTFAAAIGASVEGLTRGLAVDLKPIRVNVVLPGAIHTELFQGLLDVSTPEKIAGLKKGFSLLDAFGQPEDIAEAYAWIMRDRFANGGLVTSDGGRLLVGTESLG
ncbi:NAD(P)-binding protein [Cucurbitaria berberidis CBS 394.84]|uniref:NAD(P)-binding protein n=1 Tax=Cucurbitaria berberidis CBS 394.84 TaxID=1168544 RepID=A0A9P4G7D1_9PLEO|nr:NAD(P)-binding protein [Cucurbitaria berberidis CBS 394.84]KAF1840408.1 NAD(P)-binding protein [Cucurbitaria berberidis CBS 394.84]